MAKEIGLNRFKEHYDSTDNPIIQDIPEQVKIVTINGMLYWIKKANFFDCWLCTCKLNPIYYIK